jgi:hypothetical protein
LRGRGEIARRRAAPALVAALALAGCGEKDEPSPSRARAVTGTVDLDRPAPGAPDAGTTAGHRAPDATASTSRSALSFGGRVDPASSRVTLAPAGGPAGRVAVARDGSFRARARSLRRGQNRFVLRGRAAGLVPWKVDISITRR